MNHFRNSCEIYLLACSDVSESFLSSQSHPKFFRVRVESKELLSRFESLVCKLESKSSHTKFHVFFYDTFFAMKWHTTCHKIAPDKSKNRAQHAMKWRPIS